MDDAIREYCIQMGYAQHVVEGGLDHLLARWEKTVAEIAAGYCLEFYDFLNDMDGRRILAEVLTVATKEQKQSAELRLKKADRLFLSSTVESSACVWGKANEVQHGYSQEKYWWYYRVPVGSPDWSVTEW
jgi:hypothetical protein